MDYFELFDLPRGFDVDKSALTKAYYRLNKKYHPDSFTLSSVEEQAIALSCLLYTSPSPRDATLSRMPSSA